MPGPRSLRARFLLVVGLGAVLPLALVGAWLAVSSVRAAERRVRDELDAALRATAAATDVRWSLVRADLLLLAGNVEVRGALAGAGPDDAEVRDYLERVHRSGAGAAASVRVRDAAGRERWMLDGEVASGRGGVTTIVRYPIAALPAAPDRGRAAVGELEAELRPSGLVPETPFAPGIPGAELVVLRRPGEVPVRLSPSARTEELRRERFEREGTEWLVRRLEMAEPALDLVAVAPLTPHVAPFRRAARLGATALAVVAVVVLVLTTYLTTRVTRGLEQLAVATERVARGDLEARVALPPRDEVGRMAAVFNQMTESLRRTLDELSRQRSLAAVGEFAAALSHEVRNALTSVRLDLQRVQRHARVAGAADDELVARALRQVGRLEHTVAGALRVARSGRTGDALIDLSAVLDAAAERIAAQAQACGSTVQIAPAPETVAHVRGDGAALEQLFLNLLLNALEAAPGRPVAAMLSLQEARATVTISDGGPGVPESVRDAVFAPFYTTKPGGTGLGLAIARNIAEAHGGTLAFTRDAGGRSAVVASLPTVARTA